MRSEVDELKRFAIADILSVSGKQKTTETINMHINTIIDIAFLKGQQPQQSKVDELQKRLDVEQDKRKKWEEACREGWKKEDELQLKVVAQCNELIERGERIRYLEYKGGELQNNINLLNEALDIKEQLNQKLREREDELQKQLIDQGQRFNEQAQRVKDLEHKNNELQKRLDAFKEHAVMLREAAKSHVYTEREQNILISQADDIDKILGLEQALKGGGE